MNYLFKNCYSLTSLPDISKWDISKVKEMEDIFKGCFELLVIPKKFIK